MPLLRDLNCSIELSDDQEPLQELGTVYGDGLVETFVPVPKKQQTFTVHLSSRKFIAPGIAMYVFIDGIYQCNRNRQNLKLRRPPDRRSLVDFKVRQKEERQKDGSMIAREWTFENLDLTSADSASTSCSPNVLANIGCIEVVILRCAGPRKEKTASNMNMDGAADYWTDSESQSRGIAYDDRNPFASAANSLPTYRPPHAETVHSHRRSREGPSRFSEPISPRTRPQDKFPMAGVQYGSGPLPPRTDAERHRDASQNKASRPTRTVDAATLEKIVADAVKRGVEESKKSARSVDGESDWLQAPNLDTSSQVPGAWPSPPTPKIKAKDHHSSRSQGGTQFSSRDELAWDRTSMINGWGSLGDDPTDSWEADDTWPSKRPESWEEVRTRTRSKLRIASDMSPPHWAPHISQRKSSHRHRAPSDTSTSLEPSDSTIKPRHSRSKLQTSRVRSSRHKSSRGRSSEQKISHLIEDPKQHLESMIQAQPSFILLANAPTVPPAPIPLHPVEVESRRPSTHTQAPATIGAPPPTWGCASEKPRKSNAATTFLPPAPFSTAGEELHVSRKSSGSSSWEVTDKKASRHGSEKNASSTLSLWGEKNQMEKEGSTWGDADKDEFDWGDEKAKGWEDEDAADQKDTTWDSPQDADNKWGDVKDTAKDAVVDGWDKGDNIGRDDGFNTDQPSAGEANGWETDNAWDNNDGWGKDTKANDDTGFNASTKSSAQNNKGNDADGFKASDWAAAPAPAPSTKAGKRPPSSKRHTTKSLSKYRQLSAPAPTSTSHRQFPPPPPKKTLRPVLSEGASARSASKPPPLPSVPAEPLHKMPASTASDKKVQHQVLAGPGTQYGHAVSRPEYIDCLDSPYAVFRFKYRSRSALRSMFGDKCLSKSANGDAGAGREGLEKLSREELVRKMMALQARVQGEGEAKSDAKSASRSRSRSRCTQSVAKVLTEKWVKDHSKVDEEKEGLKEGGKREEEKAGGWGAGASAGVLADPIW
ncbi:hypothetical protein G6514_002574 [Epicoccum nigrum]|nr:hypothetical protein G6514_002574 [Epicoccum nigrum]